MAKIQPFKGLRKALRKLYGRASDRFKHFTNQTDEVLTQEPIDFSAPSIPYYENLANRLSFVRVVLYMVLLVFIVVTVVCNHRLITYENLYYLAKDIGAAAQTARATAETISYPISSSDADFALYRGGVVVAGSEVVTAMSGSGRQTLSVNVAYASPCVRASDKYCLSFGRGENSFAVYNSFVQVYREITDFPVYEAVLGDNGSFAVVTRSRDYTSEVILYDSNMEKLANYHLNGYVTGISMNQTGDRVGIVSVESVNGLWETKVTVIRAENRISQSSATVSGSFGSTCGFVDDDRFAVILNDRVMIWGSDATVKGEVKLGDGIALLSAVGNGRIAILSRAETDLKATTLRVYNKNGKLDYEVNMNEAHPVTKAGGADQLCFGGSVLFIRAGETLFRMGGSGGDLSAAEISRDTLAILPVNGDEVFVCTPAYANRLDKEDFASG